MAGIQDISGHCSVSRWLFKPAAANLSACSETLTPTRASTRSGINQVLLWPKRFLDDYFLKSIIVRQQVIMRLDAPDEATIRQELDSLVEGQLRTGFQDLLQFRSFRVQIVFAIDVEVLHVTDGIVSPKSRSPLRVASPAVGQITVRPRFSAIGPIQSRAACQIGIKNPGVCFQFNSSAQDKQIAEHHARPSAGDDFRSRRSLVRYTCIDDLMMERRKGSRRQRSQAENLDELQKFIHGNLRPLPARVWPRLLEAQNQKIQYAAQRIKLPSGRKQPSHSGRAAMLSLDIFEPFLTVIE